MRDWIKARSFGSAVDRDWEPDQTPCSSGDAGKLFALIRQALLDETPVYVDVIRLDRYGPGDSHYRRVCDLQHKAGDWMRVLLVPQNPDQGYLGFDECREFSSVTHVWIGDTEYRARLPQTTVSLTPIYP